MWNHRIVLQGHSQNLKVWSVRETTAELVWRLLIDNQNQHHIVVCRNLRHQINSDSTPPQKQTPKLLMTHRFYGHDPERKQHMLKSLPTSEMCVKLVAASLLIIYFLLTSNIFTRNSFPVKLESWNIVCDVNRPDV